MEVTANLAAYKAENQHVNRAVRGQVDKINISLYMGVCGGGWGGVCMCGGRVNVNVTFVSKLSNS